jgi:hypothetical protein
MNSKLWVDTSNSWNVYAPIFLLFIDFHGSFVDLNKVVFIYAKVVKNIFKIL